MTAGAPDRLAPRWLTPDWPAPDSVRALSTLRIGGISESPYASLNLGGHVEDAATAVALNRRALRQAAALPADPAWLDQVHGTCVKDLDSPGASSPADAVVTRQPGRVCAILTADCLPILLCSESGDRVAAAHAGWRGLAAGVIEAAVNALEITPHRVLAWLGPAIGPEHFEIGAEVRAALLDGDPSAAAAFESTPQGRFMADLYALARRRLVRLGVRRIFGGGACSTLR